MFRYFADNAMIYKDLTQWFRRKSFALHYLLFFAICQLIFTIGFFISSAEDIGEPVGEQVAGVLAATLVGIAYVLSGQAFMLIRTEIQSRTMELFLLSGVSLERIILGRWATVLFQFLLCGVVLLPFMIGAVFFGGVDPFSVAASITLTVLIILFLSMYAIIAGVYSQSRQIRVLMALFTFAMLCWLTVMSFMTWGTFLAGEEGPISVLADVFKEAMEFNWDYIIGLLLSLIVIVEMLVFMFFGACHAIRPASDTRARHLQVSYFVLFASFMGIFYYMFWASGFDDDVIIPGAIIIFLAVLAGGVTALYTPEVQPMMDIARMRKWNPLKRVLLIPTGHDTGGGARFTLLLVLTSALWAIVINATSSFSPDQQAYAGLVYLAPWYLVFPGFILGLNRKLRKKHTTMRVLVIAFWILSAVIISIFMAIVFRRSTEGFYFISSLLTPFWGLGLSLDHSNDAAIVVQMSLGILGVVVLILHTFQRTIAMNAKYASYIVHSSKTEEEAQETTEPANIAAEEEMAQHDGVTEEVMDDMEPSAD